MPLSPHLELEATEAAFMLNGGVLAVNVHQMKEAGPRRPRVYELIRSKKLVYSPYDPEEEWKFYGQVLREVQRDGVSKCDCEDIASMVAAEMVTDGVDLEARPWSTSRVQSSSM
jgi:hypothetical protein